MNSPLRDSPSFGLPTSGNPCAFSPRGPGFSLVEIVIALGIFSFCLIAVMGLFTAGLKTERASQEEEGAISTQSSLALAVENSFRNTNGTFSCGAPLDGWSWDPASVTTTNGRLGDYAFWLRIQVVKTAGEAQLANARLEVAWPPDSVHWDAEGHPSGMRSASGSSSFFIVK